MNIKSTVFAASAICAAIANANEQIILDEIVVTGGTELTAEEMTTNVTTISAQEIQRSGASTVQEALESAVGFNFTTNSSSFGGRQNIGLRGQDSSRVLVLIDGKRVIQSDDYIGHSNFQTQGVGVNSIERIEIVRSAGSVIYGSNAIGGVINIITKKTEDAFNGSVSLFGSTAADRDHGTRRGVSVLLNAPLTATTNLQMDLTRDNLDPAVTNGSNVVQGDNSRTTALKFEQQINDKLTIDANYRNGTQVLTTKYVNQRDDRGIEISGSIAGWDLSVARQENKADFRYTTYSYSHKIENDVTRAAASGELGSASVTLGFETATESYFKDYDNNANDYRATPVDQDSTFAQAVWDLNNVALVAGVRVDDNSQFGSEASPELGASFELNNGLQARVQYAESFKAPNIKEADANYVATHYYGGGSQYRGNAELKAETGQTVSVGISGGNEWQWSADAFRSKVNGLIESADTGNTTPVGSNPNAPIYTYRNVKDATIKGLELTAATSLSNAVDLDLNAAYLNTDNGEGGELANRPEWAANANLDRHFGNGFSGRLGIKYTGKQKSASGNDVTSFVTADLGATKSLNDNLSLRVGIDNVTNEKRDGANDNALTELVGREYRASLTYSF